MFFLVSVIPLIGQSIKRVIRIDTDTTIIDSLSIIPGSVIIEDNKGVIVDSKIYTIDYGASQLIFIDRSYCGQSYEITYRTFPYDLDNKYFHKDISLLENQVNETTNPFTYDPYASKSSFTNFGDLDYNGSFSRGISFGNSQDVALSSSFNLQLTGKLNNEVDIVAALTDDNIPIQPEGNTQQIQDFDNVFIQLSKDSTSLIMGDFLMDNPPSHFMQYKKKTQGLGFQTAIKNKKKSTLRLQSELGVSRGKWARNQFVAEEGNQGPYKLTGGNGEVFIIILSGTERVYIDGVRMERGAENDYIIDYNTGEVTFMPNQLITKDKRISIEFQYSEQSYLRTLSHVGAAYGNEQSQFRFDVYSEQDAKNQPINRELSNEDKLVLSSAGADPALVSGVDTALFDETRVLYKMIDSLGYDSVFVYSTNPDSARFTLSFSFVGAGNGNYAIAQSTANGRVYQWVAPALGQPQGDYEPIVLLVAPNRQQMFSLGFDRKLGEHSILSLEGAMSNNDVNTFSKVDNTNNQGFSGKVAYQTKYILNEEKKTTINIMTDYEYRDHNFEVIERYRPVEFNRNWNLIDQVLPNDEHIINGTIGIARSKQYNVNYNLSSFIRGNDYMGFKHATNSFVKRNGYQLKVFGSLMTSREENRSTNFFRPRVDLSKTFERLNNWVIGAYFEQEDNEILESDTLSKSSFKYDVYKVYAQSADTNENQFGLDLTRRIDHIPINQGFKISTEANSVNVFGALNKNPASQFRWNVSYRELYVKDTNALNASQDEQSILGRLEYLFVVKNGLIRSNTLYELSRGQERKRDFQFIPVVLDGTGTHYWEDFNEDGIDQKNEYVPAVLPGQGTHIKQFIFANEFVKTNQIRFNEILSINPKAVWYREDGIKKFISRFSTQSSVQVSKQVIADNEFLLFNPFLNDIADSVLVSATDIIRNSIFFNRVSGNFGLELTRTDDQSKTLLTNGLDLRTRREYVTKARANLSSSVTINMDYASGTKSNISQFFSVNNYVINYTAIEPNISYIANNKYRLSLGYSLVNNRNNADYGGGQNTNNKVEGELRYNTVGKSVLTLNASFIKIDTKNFEAIQSTPVAYAMLEGLQAGDNILWAITYERTLSNNIQMSLRYDGRQTGNDNPVVHTGSAQVRAIF